MRLIPYVMVAAFLVVTFVTRGMVVFIHFIHVKIWRSPQSSNAYISSGMKFPASFQNRGAHRQQLMPRSVRDSLSVIAFYYFSSMLKTWCHFMTFRQINSSSCRITVSNRPACYEDSMRRLLLPAIWLKSGMSFGVTRSCRAPRRLLHHAS